MPRLHWELSRQEEAPLSRCRAPPGQQIPYVRVPRHAVHHPHALSALVRLGVPAQLLHARSQERLAQLAQEADTEAVPMHLACLFFAVQLLP